MNNYADEIMGRLPAREVFERYGCHVNQDGYACCPFHGEKAPSCKVYPGERGWYCFGCHAGGDVLKFVQKYFGLNFQEAAAKLNDDFGLCLPIGKKLTRAEQTEANRRNAERLRKVEARKRRREALEKKWDDALTVFVKCDKIIQNCQPISHADFSDEFCWAVKNIDRAAYELSEAETALFRFRQEEKI